MNLMLFQTNTMHRMHYPKTGNWTEVIMILKEQLETACHANSYPSCLQAHIYEAPDF
jgi:hypothetical protein